MTQVEEDKVMVLMDGKDLPFPPLFLDICLADPVLLRNAEPLQALPGSCFASQ